jgi:tetrahydrodipicolinate N-succinyltransferase
MNEYLCIAPDVKLGKGVKLAKFINLYGCEIGDETKIGTFVEIQKNAKVGRRCKISTHTFICEGVTIEDHVFIGHGVTFINDSYRTTPDREGLEARGNPGEDRRVDRVRGDDPLERGHRGECHRRGRQCRHPGGAG